MKIIKINLVLAILILTSLVPSYAQKKQPEFSEYKVKQADFLKGKPKPVNLSSYKGARTYRTRLREGAKEGPNFAGHYTVVTFGCGTQCQDNWVIDARTGKIIDRFDSVIAPTYRLDSQLLIINPPNEDYKRAYQEHPEQPLLGTMETTFRVLKNSKFKVVYKDKWVNVN